MKQGSGYIGSPALQTSVANQEIIPPKPNNWVLGYQLYKFSFINTEACTIIINGGDPIYLRANQGFAIDQNDKKITSFKIVEDNVTYNYIAAY